MTTMVFSALHNEDKPTNHSDKQDEAVVAKSPADKGQIKPERILTIPNVITFLRLLLVPLVFVLIINEGNNLLAFSLFALAGLTDFVDGYIARKTNTVTEFGKAIDPLVDRLLLGCGVLALFVIGELPIWILIFAIFRDFFLLSGLAIVRKITEVEIRIRNIGKITTTLLLTGFAGLILGIGTIPAGLGWTDSTAFPGFSADPYFVWIWLIYLGLLFSFMTLIAYVYDGIQLIRSAKMRQEESCNEA
ncbi:MAG: CDP-alcohol phosphatidyltransferase family protein [Coriobacteriia bacterium]|nr:CDP-alcohol phosphatidyltransferase family protein [Coriobacteriia bacterium]